MSFNDEQRRAILEYGETKYYIGYRDGFVFGCITGSLLGLLGAMIITIIKENN